MALHYAFLYITTARDLAPPKTQRCKPDYSSIPSGIAIHYSDQQGAAMSSDCNL